MKRILCLLLASLLILTGCGTAVPAETAAAPVLSEAPAETAAVPESTPEPAAETPRPMTEVVETEDPGLQKAFALIDSVIANDVNHGFPSAQLAVIQNGQLIYRNHWGDVTDDTLYDLASLTKMFSIVYAVQYLVTRGQLSLDTKIVDIIGQRFADDTLSVDYACYAATDLETNKEWKRELTVRQVLCHRAGFPADPQYMKANYDLGSDQVIVGYESPFFSGYDGSDETRERTLESICKTPLMYDPNDDRYCYSDVDYMLMCYVVEAVTGQRLDAFLQETFLDPLELDHITYNPMENGFYDSDCAGTELHGNTRDGAVWFEGIRTEPILGQVHDEKAWYCMGGVSGHAGLFADAADLARLAWVMMDGTDGNGNTFFSEDVISEFTSPDIPGDRYGIGWWRQGDGERSYYFGSLCSSGTIGHNGWTGTMVMIDRENGLVIVLLTNRVHTAVTDPWTDPNRFDGDYYAACSFGFVPQLIYDGLYGYPMTYDLQALEQLVQAKADNYPCDASYEALASIQETCAGFQE